MSEARKLEYKLKNITSVKRLEAFMKKYPVGGIPCLTAVRQAGIPPHSTKTPSIDGVFYSLKILVGGSRLRKRAMILLRLQPDLPVLAF